MWRRRNLTPEGKIIIFKTLGLSIIFSLSFTSQFSSNTKRVLGGDLFYIRNHRLIENNLRLSLEKLTSKEFYSIWISKKNRIPTSQQYFDSLFPDSSLDWKLINLLPKNISRVTS